MNEMQQLIYLLAALSGILIIFLIKVIYDYNKLTKIHSKEIFMLYGLLACYKQLNKLN